MDNGRRKKTNFILTLRHSCKLLNAEQFLFSLKIQLRVITIETMGKKSLEDQTHEELCFEKYVAALLAF